MIPAFKKTITVPKSSLSILLWNVESDMNLGLIIRDCYMLGDGQVSLKVFDSAGVFSDKRDTIRSFSSYSIDHFKNLQVMRSQEEANAFLKQHEGRLICTTPDEDSSCDLNKFTFQQNDLIIFGNEYYGLPKEIMNQSKYRIIIPMLGSLYNRPDLGGKVQGVGTQRCLGISSSVAIVLYIALQQTLKYRQWRLFSQA